MKRARRYTITTAAGILTALLLALPTGAQDSPAIANGGGADTPRTQPPDLDPADCSNGTFVAEPDAEPGLVADCRALVSIRNHWTRQTVPTDAGILTWGTGDTAPITAWRSIRIEDQRVISLWTSFNGLRGAIPAEIGQLTHLTGINLQFNELTGAIPAEIGQLTKLELLFLAANKLTGPIPPEISQLTNLTDLELAAGNRLTGSIPAELSQLTNLTVLELGSNRLTGPIPPEIGQLTNLTRLRLEYNRLTGSIPAELSQLTNLTDLALHGNELTGSIPAELSQLTNLKILNLENNGGLNGSIPAEIVQQLTNQNLRTAGTQLYKGTFSDDDTNTHETNIETIAGWDITQGCGINLYCPGDSITRRQMAAFLHRAVTHRTGTEPTVPTDPPALNDVEGSSLRYIQWAAAAGVMQAPEGRFNPRGTVTRADMAEMMAAAFDHITPPAAASGIFEDMTGQPDTVIRAAEALRTAKVTAGCSTWPLRYCPDQPVTRAQMASFFARALS